MKGGTPNGSEKEEKSEEQEEKEVVGLCPNLEESPHELADRFMGAFNFRKSLERRSIRSRMRA